LEDINSSLQIACTETCDGDVNLTHYIKLVKTYQEKKKGLEEIESQLFKSEASMFMAQMEKDKRLNDLLNNDKKFFGNIEKDDEDDEEDNDNN
jgi:L-lactate utilization protein LutB